MVDRVTVDMGAPVLEAADIPTTIVPSGHVIDHEIEFAGRAYKVTCVSMGNPHCVIFVDKATDELVLGLGPKMETDPRFPNRTNIEFVEVLNRGHLRQRTWERGSGETWACGTGASAVCVAGVLTGRTDRGVQIDFARRHVATSMGRNHRSRFQNWRRDRSVFRRLGAVTMMHPGYDSPDPGLPEATSSHAVSVSELTGHIKAILEGTFPSIWVAGEISDLVKARSGHLYFTLKDNDAQVRGIIWRSTAMRLSEEIKEGQSVLCMGDVEVYAARGTYQLVVRKVQQQGLGPLQQKFEKLRATLHAEGLFAAESKQSLPTFPRRVGVITSPTSAAVRDFLKAASGRFRGAELIVIPALVQGNGSVSSIVKAIQAAHAIKPQLDVIVLTRGGGSLEDLWSFNEEAVVRAVAGSSLPIVSAIGHEIDITLCDLAADVRALTPTDAASQVLPDADRMKQTARELEARLLRLGELLVTSRRESLLRFESSAAFRKPFEIIHSRSRLLDELDQRASRAIEAKLKLTQSRLATAAASLSALSPLDVLTRGYSVTMDANGTAITDATELSPGDVIRTRLNQGEIRSTVE